jgi:hypothetical protein
MIKVKIGDNATGLEYSFTLYRKLTFLSGDSGTGKSTLVNLVSTHRVIESQWVDCVLELIELSNSSDIREIQCNSGRILFLDEDHTFLFDSDFIPYIKRSNCYFVLVGRKKFLELPFDLDSIYKINSSERLHTISLLYDFSDIVYTRPDVIVVEDSGSGFDFYKLLFENLGIKLLSSSGVTNILKIVDDIRFNETSLEDSIKIMVIMDNCSLENKIISINPILSDKTLQIFAENSFEWILEVSDMIIDFIPRCSPLMPVVTRNKVQNFKTVSIVENSVHYNIGKRSVKREQA